MMYIHNHDKQVWKISDVESRIEGDGEVDENDGKREALQNRDNEAEKVKQASEGQTDN